MKPTKRLFPVLLAVLALAACKKAEAPVASAAKTESKAEPAKAPKAPKAPRAAKDPALALIPATADGVALLDVSAALHSWAPWLLALPAGGPDAKAFVADLASILERRFGVDIRGASTGVFFVRADKMAGAVLLGVHGAPKGGEAVGEKDGIALIGVRGPVVAAALEQGLAIGTRKAVELLIETAKGKAPNAAVGKEATDLRRALDAVGPGEIRIACSPTRLSLPVAELGVPALPWLAVAVGGAGATVVGQGTKEQVSAAEKALKEALDNADREAVALRDAAAGDPATELAGILAVHANGPFRKHLRIDNAGDKLVVHIPNNQLLVLAGVAYTGVVAAVAIPAFIKYIRRAKTTEAVGELDKLYKAAAVYYTTPGCRSGTDRNYLAFCRTRAHSVTLLS